MFGLFKSGKSKEPLDYESRKYFENNLLWLEQEFPFPSIEERIVLTPTKDHFPLDWNVTESTAMQAIKIICQQMQVSFDELQVDFFDSGMQEIDMGNNTLFLENDLESESAAGLYFHQKEGGKYTLAFDKKIIQQPESLIATIAHELAHVKLHGEKELPDNDELLVDLTTVFFGMGIFNANSCFLFHQSVDRWGYNQLGYLKQEEWAYALALFAFVRSEDHPVWSQYLNPTVRKDFDNYLRYMIANENDIFHFEE